MSSVLFNVVAIALVLGAAYVLWSLVTLRSRQEDQRREDIKDSGRKVWAILVSKQPTGQSATSDTKVQYRGQYYVLLQLDVPQPDGTVARCTIKDLPSPDWKPLEPGDQVEVYQKVDDPTQVTLNTLMTPRYVPSQFR